MLSLRGAGLTVETRALLHPVNLNFRPGRLYGLIGHNGSGKSTLIRLLARQHAPTHGEVLLDDVDIRQYGARRYARHVGYLPQHLPAVSTFVARALIELGRYPWKGPWGRHEKRDSEAIARAIALTQVQDLLERPSDELSGGERQRVWLTMLLAQDSRYLLLDEPLAALDLCHQMEVMGLIRKLATHRNAGVILSVHDINMAARYCDELVVLRRGRIIYQGEPKKLMTSVILRDIFGVPLHVIEHPDNSSLVAVV